MTESLKGLKLNQGTTGASGLMELVSDVINMKKTDWNEIIEKLIGTQKLCNLDTTDTTETTVDRQQADQQTRTFSVRRVKPQWLLNHPRHV